MIHTFQTTLSSKKQVAADTWQFHFALPRGQKLEFTAGQYMLLKAPHDFVSDYITRFVNPQIKARGVTDIGEAVRQYSISSAPAISDSFELLVQLVPNGLGSMYLNSLPEGATVTFQGPAGVFTLGETAHDTIFLATGTGIAPIRSMLWDKLSHKNNTDKPVRYMLFWGLRRSSDVYYLEEFRQLAETHKNFSFRICLSRQEDVSSLDSQCFGFGRVDKHLINFLDPEKNYDVAHKEELTQYHNQFEYYICGGDKIVDALRNLVLGLGVGKQHIHFEKFV